METGTAEQIGMRAFESVVDELLCSLRVWRDAPGFAQRFSATLGRDSFEGLWQLARTPGDWQDDLRVSYRRRD